jgi:CheY-like chemotaxis protein
LIFFNLGIQEVRFMFATEEKLHVDQTAQEKITVLVVSPHHDDHNVVRRLLQHGQWSIVRAVNLREALDEIQKSNPAVIICERDLPDGTWRDVLRRVSNLKRAPSVIVTSRQADETLWADVLNSGGYDVLPKPFERSEAIRVLGMAWRFACGMKRRPAMAVSAF